MKNYAEEERLLSQTRKMLISSFTLQNGTLITPLLLFYLQLGLVCTKIHRFVEYTPKKQKLRSNDCVDSFTADAVANFFPRTCCVKRKQHDKREPGLYKEEFRCTEMLCLCSKTYCCYDVTSNETKFSSKGLNKRVLEQSGDGPLEKYRRVLNEKVNVTSNNRGFRTNNHSVATYEQVKKGFAYFHPKRLTETDGRLISPLNLKDVHSFLILNCRLFVPLYTL